MMEQKTNVSFKWHDQTFKGQVEREYQNAFLINVIEPYDKEIVEKYANRVVVSKKVCRSIE